MSITDNHLYFTDGVAVTSGSISDVVDRDADPVLANFGGFGADLYLVIQTGAAFTGTNFSADLVSDSTANLATSPTVHASTGLRPVAELGANTVVAVLAVPPGDYERYIGLKYSGTFGAGTVKAFMTRDPNYWRGMTANNPQVANDPLV